jgi:hypothetical protein
MTMEQRMDQLEKRNKRLTVALTMMAVAMCAVVTMAAKDDKISTFDTVRARTIFVDNDAGEIVVAVGANENGDGVVYTQSAKGEFLVEVTSSPNGGSINTYQPNGKTLVKLSSTVEGDGLVTTYDPNGTELVALSAFDNGGLVSTYQPNGKPLVKLGASSLGTGGLVYVYNKTGESIAQMSADEYGNGVVYAGNRKGMGRELRPGP